MANSKTLYFVFAYYLCSNIDCASAQCSWNVNGTRLDLGCLSGRTVTTTDTAIDLHAYEWSICANNQACSESGNVMVCQYLESDPQAGHYILGRWDAGILPKYDSSERSWTFVYNNGDTDCGNPARTWEPKFICNSGVEFQIGTVSEIPGSCDYKVDIQTKFACPGQNYACSESSGISGGWIFIIVLFSAFFLYCVIGYVVMATTKNKAGGFGDFANNIPQKDFWAVLPKLVVAGCVYSKEIVMGLFNKDGGGDDKAEPMAQEETAQ